MTRVSFIYAIFQKEIAEHESRNFGWMKNHKLKVVKLYSKA